LATGPLASPIIAAATAAPPAKPAPVAHRRTREAVRRLLFIGTPIVIVSGVLNLNGI
jgi:hypothetical protein